MSLPALVAADGVTPLASAAASDIDYQRPYRAASTHSAELGAWRPALTSGDSAVLGDREFALSRAQDLGRDNPHARAGTKRWVDLLVGSGVRLVASFDAESLGLDRVRDKDTIRAVRRAIEREYRLFSNNPLRHADAARQMSLNGRFRQLARTWTNAGEACYALRWNPAAGRRYRTCLQAIDPARLCNPDGQPDSVHLRGGVERDGFGAAVAYHIRNAHLADAHLGAAEEACTWERVPRETKWGRPVFVHGFEPEREGQTRAMTPFAAVVESLKMLDNSRRYELANVAANALIVATMESSQGADAAGQAFNIVNSADADAANLKRATYYAQNRPVLNGVRIPVLPIGDKLNLNNAPRATAEFGEFEATFLRSIAAALGLSYEQLAMDWSKVNYSSARAALNEVWRGVKTEFAAFCEQVIMPVYMAFLEEAFDRGYIVPPAGCPSFWDMPEAWAACRWIGSPRGYVDPVKEAQGQAIRLDNLTSTLEVECAEQGVDFEELLDQRQYEDEELRARGLARIGHNAGPPNDREDEAPAGRSKD